MVSLGIHGGRGADANKPMAFCQDLSRLLAGDTQEEHTDQSMHELPIAQSILDIALRHAESAEARQISGIYLVIGQLSSFVDESIQFYWDIISKDTIAVGATLHFRRIPAQLRCRDCDTEYSLNDRDSACPACGGINIEIVSGDELYVEAIDIEAGS